MRIFYLIDSLNTGGAEKSLLEICAALPHLNPIFLVLSGQMGELEQTYKSAGIAVVRLPHHVNLNSSSGFQAVLRLVTELQPDIIHSTLIHADKLSRKLGRSLGIPVINSLVNNTYCLRRYRLEPWNVKFKLFGIQLWDTITSRQVDLFISNSEAIAKSYSAATWVSRDRIRTIVRGRSPRPFDEVSQEAVDNLRDRFQLNDKKVFLHLGRMIRRKGQEEIIRAFARFCMERFDVVLLLAGSGPSLGKLRAVASELGVADRIIFLGTWSDVPLLMRAADFLVFPSYFEGLPGTLIEAMLARLPILASEIPENRECISNDLALWHRAGDVDDLVRSMQQALLVDNWPLRVEAARQEAMTKFDLVSVAKAYEDAYKDLLRRYHRA